MFGYNWELGGKTGHRLRVSAPVPKLSAKSPLRRFLPTGPRLQHDATAPTRLFYEGDLAAAPVMRPRYETFQQDCKYLELIA